MIVVLGRRFSVPFFTKRPLITSRTRLPGPAPRFFAFSAMNPIYPDTAAVTHTAYRWPTHCVVSRLPFLGGTLGQPNQSMTVLAT